MQSRRDQGNKARVGRVVAYIKQVVVVTLTGCSDAWPGSLQLAGWILEQYRQGHQSSVCPAWHLDPSVAGQLVVGRFE